MSDRDTAESTVPEDLSEAELAPKATSMSSLDAASEVTSPAGLLIAPDGEHWSRFDALMSRASDFLNPILVKEARQALRSKQFVFTFMGMLLAGWAWSILGLALGGNSVYYSASGPWMFIGFFLILSVPLMVAAPYAAYQSLAAEMQDRTFELLSITTLEARQILSGRLSSVALQMSIYLSAIFPCLAFTYLLRGMDIVQIGMSVLYTCFLSLGMSMLGLLMASMIVRRQRQILFSLVFAVLIAWTWISLFSMITQVMVLQLLPIGREEFWIAHSILLTFYLNCFALTFLAARSHLLPITQNRSTALRVALVVAQLSFFAWMTYAQWSFGGEVVYSILFFSGGFWYLCGTFLTGEPRILSPRVKRGLPQSLLGRVFLTWFFPGAGTGYMFVISNLTAVTLMTWVMAVVVPSFYDLPQVSTTGLAPTTILETGGLIVAYATIYLGLGKLLLGWIGRFYSPALSTRVAIHLLLLIAGMAPPWVLQATLDPRMISEYTLLQIGNPVWTIGLLCTKGLAFELPYLITCVPAAALIVWLLNFPGLIRELQQVHIAKPPRLEQDDKELAGTVGIPQSPWG